MESVPGDESHILLLLYCYSAFEILIKRNSGFMVYSSESVKFPEFDFWDKCQLLGFLPSV